MFLETDISFYLFGMNSFFFKKKKHPQLLDKVYSIWREEGGKGGGKGEVFRNCDCSYIFLY